MQQPALVILAAGASRRLGVCKALVSLGGHDADVATPLSLLLEAGAVLDDVPALIVTGAHHAEIAAAGAGAELVCNPDWAAGRLGGILLAARARSGRALCLAPVDVPLVPRDVFQALLDAWCAAGCPARGWLAPRVLVDGEWRFGHPVIVGPELLDEAREWPAARPLRELRERAEALLSVPVEALGILDDLDQPQDLVALRARMDRS